MATSLTDRFQLAKQEHRPTFIPYITAGYPSPEFTVPILLALQHGGADIIELGVPFTDPLADGPTIQYATQIALQQHTDLEQCFHFVQCARLQGLTVPVIFMGYYNPFYQFGQERLMQESIRVGVQGFIIVDLSPIEAQGFRHLAQAYGLSYIPLVTPTTSLKRLETVIPLADSFIYVVSRSGVTGEQVDVATDLDQLISRIRRWATVPLAVGFGVTTQRHFEQVGRLADGVVMGSKLISVIRDAELTQTNVPAAVQSFVTSITGRHVGRLIPDPDSTIPPSTIALPAEGMDHYPPPLSNSNSSDSLLICSLDTSDFVLNPRFGDFGGQYVPEALVDALQELEQAFVTCKDCDLFWKEFHSYSNYIGRPSSFHLAERLTQYATRENASIPAARIWLKREDLNHSGSHKINNALGQILLAKRLGKTRIIAETGAGQHGVATATICAKLGMECVIYMGAVDCARQQLNVFKIELLGGKVIPVSTGSQTLKDAINEAMRDWVTNVTTTHYLVGSAIGPHPFPRIVREFQSIISKEMVVEFRKQNERGKMYPDAVVACVGGGSNAIGAFAAILDSQEAKHVRLVGSEAGGDGDQQHSATLSQGTPGILHGTRTLLLQTPQGQVKATHSISAGLDYPGVGPEHAYLKSTGRVEYRSVTDQQCLSALKVLAHTEGIIAALETAHAVHSVIEVAQEMGTGKDVVLCVSGRGDKDMAHVMELLKLDSCK
jgi:tryptophan synthase